MMTPTEALAVADAFRAIYPELDRLYYGTLAKGVRERFSCRAGCYGCCLQFVMVTFLEAVLAAQAVLTFPDWIQVAQGLSKLAKRMTRSYDIQAHFQAGTRCAFLDREANTCRIYDVRPVVCRFHHVCSPPEDCYPAPDGNPRRVLLTKMTAPAIAVFHFCQEALGEVVLAPLPLAVLHAMALLAPNRTAFGPLLHGLMAPKEWHEAILGTVVEQTQQ